MLLQQPFHFSEIPVRRRNDTGVALDRLGDHCGDGIALIRQCRLQRREGAACRFIGAKPPLVRPGNKRDVRVLRQLWIGPPHLETGHAHRQVRPAVQPLLQRQESPPPRMHAGQQQGAFIRLRAAVDEERPAQIPRQHIG
ncbi:hypothetical protein D3C74_252960 [compost metagenome]